MKQNIKTIALIAVAAISASCDIAEFGSRQDGHGSLAIDLHMSDVVTRAQMSEDELLNTAVIRIYNADFSGLVREYQYSSAPQTIYLASGEYRVDVVAGEAVKTQPATASWEQKSYYGSSPFTIVPGQTTSVLVEAGVSNAVTSVSFDKTVSELFNGDYTLSIGIDGTDADLVYSVSNSGAEGYFIVKGLVEPEFRWTFSGTLAKDGSTLTKTGSIKGIEAGKLYKMTLKYTVRDGELCFDLFVDYSTDVVDDTIIFDPVSTGLASSSVYEIWAAHATLHADVDESEYPDPSAVKFAYGTDGSDWTTADAERVSEGVYQAVVRGLAPSTEYTYKLVIGGEDIGETKTFTTEAATPVPNGSFENVSLASSGASYYVFYDPASSDPASQTMWWGSGNGTADVSGSASMGLVIALPDEGDKVDGARSACLQSKSIVGMLAAGNLFSGKFMGLVDISGGRVAFGRPWTARPTALKCWVKYSTSKMDVVKSAPDGVTVTKNDYDMGVVKVALGTWNYRTYGGSKDSPILVNTTDPSTFVDYTTDASTIAFGEAVFKGDSSNSTNVWREVTIPIEYRNTNEYPTHIVISCAASYYGDYFTGSSSSKLWIDKMELIYE